MRFGRPIPHTLGHGIWLVPNDVRAQIPPFGLQRQSDTPGNTEEILWLHASRWVVAASPPTCAGKALGSADHHFAALTTLEGVAHLGRLVTAPARCVGVPQVEPQSPV